MSQEHKTSEIRMIAQAVVEDQRQVCAAVLGSDQQRWTTLERKLMDFIEDEKAWREKSNEKLDRATLDIAAINERWRNLPVIVSVSAVVSIIALVISVAALVAALIG